MLQESFLKFVSFLDQDDKDQALHFALGLLQSKQITLLDFYYQFLTPALNNFVCTNEDASICIWKEHTRTSIIRTILESTYAFVTKEKASSVGKTVLVVCPPQEYHEIGAIIATHVFSLHGFSATYIGANTPKEDILSAVKALNPDFLALSVTNYYNLFVTKTITEQLRQHHPNVKIIIGGSAFQKSGALEQVPHDYFIETSDDVASLRKEVIL